MAGTGMRRALTLTGALIALSGCTLDFEEFRPFTEDRPPETADMDPIDFQFIDFGRPDMEVPDMEAPPADTDMDGIIDDDDNCPEDPNPDQLDSDGDEIGDLCDPDADGDDVSDDIDNCLMLSNPDQLDLDRDQEGDACDDDIDGDALPNADEMDRGTDPRRADTDGDGALDGEDACPLRADRVALDTDGDGFGDACDQDDDGDGIRDWQDNCPGTANPEQDDACAEDRDGDGIGDQMDNCPYIANPDQAIVPCESRFETLTYSRSTRALATNGGAVIAATAGGALLVDDAQIERLTNAEGLAGNRLSGTTLDAAARVWFTTDRGLTVVRRDGFVFSMHPDDGDGGPQGNLTDVAVTNIELGPEEIWVASDAGLNNLSAEAGWTVFAGDLGSPDVRGLYIDDLNRLWVATATSVNRIVDGAIDFTYGGMPDIGEYLDVVQVGAEVSETWILGTTGAVRLLRDDSVAPGGHYPGFSARDIAPKLTDTYLASDAGLQRIDRSGRRMPPGVAPLPSADLRAIVSTGEDQLWVGSTAGLVRLDSYFSTYDAAALGNDCITTTRRAGDILWVGTRQGLFRIDVAGEVTLVDGLAPGAQISEIEVVGDQVWVGTDTDVAVFALDGTPLEPIASPPLPGGAPVTAIENGADGEVWVGTDGGGLARRTADGEWIIYTVDVAPNNFLSDAVNALAYGGGELWIASQLGLSVFEQANNNFGLPVNIQGGRLPVSRVEDVAVGGGQVYAATAAGVAVRSENGLWSTLRRQVGGIPNEAGTDSARAVAYDGQSLWILLDVSRRLEYGSLLRRSPDTADREDFDLYPPSDVGLPQTSAIGGVDLTYADSELFVAFCGDGEQPGGVGILGGKGLIQETASVGLRGEGELATLTGGPDGNPMVAGQTGEGPVADAVLAAGVEPVVLPELEVPPAACGTPVSQGDNLWCVFDGVGFGRRFGNNQWNLGRKESIPALGEGDLRDIVVDTDTVAWLASAEGVIQVNGGSVRPLNTAFTGGGLPDNDVRSVELNQNRLFAGTAAGVGVLDIATNSWTAIGADALPNASVRSVAVGADGSLWIGTDDGLFQRGPDGAVVADFDTSRGLPVNRINDVLAHPDGRVFVATPGGVAVGDGMADFQTLGFVDGLPGAAAYQLVLDPDGRVWVRSDDGIARILP